MEYKQINTATQNRLHYIDVAKGVAIILVVLHHDILGTYASSHGTNMTASMLQDAQYYWLVPYFMPVFFMLTGYCSNFGKSLKPFTTSLLLSIGLPIFFFDIIPYNIELYLALPFNEWLCQIPSSLLRFVRYSYWFLRALFVAKLLYWGISRVCSGVKKSIVVVVLYVVACTAVLLGHGEHGCHSLIAMMYIGIGEICKKRNIFEDRKGLGLWATLLYILVTIFLVCLSRKAPYMANDIQIADFLDVMLMPILAISGSVAIICLAKCISENKVLEYFGRYSIVIYCIHMHPYLGQIYKSILGYCGIYIDFPNADATSTIAYVISFLIFSLCMCSLFAYIIDRPYLRVIMGKRP